MPKSIRLSLTFFVIAAAAFAQGQTQTDAQKAFAAIQHLPGMWEGKDPAGRAVRVSFKSTAGGSAVMSEILGEGPEDMISMFHLDGPNKLLLTHAGKSAELQKQKTNASSSGREVSQEELSGAVSASAAGAMHARFHMMPAIAPDAPQGVLVGASGQHRYHDHNRNQCDQDRDHPIHKA